MATTMSGTTITFNDSTTQTTAAGGAPAFLAVGYLGLLWCTLGSATLPGNTLSGSYLYKLTSGTYARAWGQSHYFNGHVTNGTASTYSIANSGSGVASNSAGTWRFVHAFHQLTTYNLSDGYGVPLTYLLEYPWQRIS